LCLGYNQGWNLGVEDFIGIFPVQIYLTCWFVWMLSVYYNQFLGLPNAGGPTSPLGNNEFPTSDGSGPMDRGTNDDLMLVNIEV
jgi:hypothetical protein